MKEKVIIVSAPSGSGKSTVVNHLLEVFPKMEFSISATSRAPRGKERNGKEYYFITADEFRKRISNGDFVEYQEVYPGSFYGTLRSEEKRIWSKGNVILFDVDVRGGINLKKIFKDKALSIFIKAPSIKALKERLEGRGTDSPEAIEERVRKARVEVRFANKFDCTVVNDNLEICFAEVDSIINEFLMKP
ncbi:MAG: guanylate kinase [Bacteroidales bacterium]|jgi:guanylate kinase|nr:guanylate kinase [Bacteroidales bacterium]MCI2121828.1 guanylate kinase [Bacteroidales bacterium]MCI2146059.1 guanylate kinase [Bacteroidales bacterium]